MNLERYMHTHLVSDSKLAEKLGVSRQSIWYWRTGEKSPRDSMKKKIQLLTGGKVSIMSWFE